MNRTLQIALLDIYNMTKNGGRYFWKEASMKKLEAVGYVRSVESRSYLNAYELTDLGRAEAARIAKQGIPQ